MVHSLIIGSKRIGKESDEVLFVSPPAISIGSPKQIDSSEINDSKNKDNELNPAPESIRQIDNSTTFIPAEKTQKTEVKSKAVTFSPRHRGEGLLGDP